MEDIIVPHAINANGNVTPFDQMIVKNDHVN